MARVGKRISEGAGGAPTADPERLVPAIVITRSSGYTPAGVDVRERISDTMITINVKRGHIKVLKKDPGIEKVKESEEVPLTTPRSPSRAQKSK